MSSNRSRVSMGYLAVIWFVLLIGHSVLLSLRSRDVVRNAGYFTVDAFNPIEINYGNRNPKINQNGQTSSNTSVFASRPTRFIENADGPLYVNEKCINCAACSMFAPSVFSREERTGRKHIVSKQPMTDKEIDESRAALAACPVAAIRVEQSCDNNHAVIGKDKNIKKLSDQLAINPNFNGRELPFPRPISPNLSTVHFVGHHNSASFGAAPYLLSTRTTSPSKEEVSWIMVDSPKYTPSSIRAVESLTGSKGPEYLVLTHVDDTADHKRWKERYPDLKRIFHAGDLGVHNWIGDQSLEDVEVLLKNRSSDHHLEFFDLNGSSVGTEKTNDHEILLIHTPGHSPGSISLFFQSGKESPGVLFSGDTYSYTTRDGGHMTGFPLYGNDARLQSKILPLLLNLDWTILAPGHGHLRDYTLMVEDQEIDLRSIEMEAAIKELKQFFD